jgi:predicted ATPase
MLQRSSALVPQAPGTTLGARLTTFVGRERDRSVVTDGLGENRLLTLTDQEVSARRVLRSRLRAVVADYSDGVWFVGLASLREPARVADAVAEELGVRTSDYEGRPSSSLRSLENHLRGREVLLILDNCEHLAAAAGELAASLLSSCPDVSLLVTSREPLGVPGEVVIEVEPLSVPAVDASAEEVARADAVLLFVERARLVRSNLNLDEATLRAIAEICVRLDGLPLALELAAARVRSLSPAETRSGSRIVSRCSIGGRAGGRAAADSRRSRRLELSASSEREQLLFRRSPSSSSFGLEAAEEICSGEGLDSARLPTCSRRLWTARWWSCPTSLPIASEC